MDERKARSVSGSPRVFHAILLVCDGAVRVGGRRKNSGGLVEESDGSKFASEKELQNPIGKDASKSSSSSSKHKIYTYPRGKT